MVDSSNRYIPATMVTQHPDHASKPFWHDQAYINAGSETEECFLSFSQLGAQEYKWDWEGKLVDESVVERLFAEHFEYFQDHKLGKEKFLTFRLPNPKVETEYRLGRAFMGMISAASLAKHVGYTHAPLFEVILPMTETAEEMIAIQEAFAEMVAIKHPLFKHDASILQHIHIIPLFEQVGVIAQSSDIIMTYIDQYQKTFGSQPPYIRPYLARSDPALNAGIVPTVVSIKIALAKFATLAREKNVLLYPIIGAASLPFRGGLTPTTVDDFIRQYQGIRTTTIQSGFKYDFPKTDVVEAIRVLNTQLARGIAQSLSPADEVLLLEIIRVFEQLYTHVIGDIAPIVNDIASFIPKRRERVQHVGLFGYSRGVGEVKLPRAIGFTAAMYSLGIPPECIGTGRGLAIAKKHGWVPLIERYYQNVVTDMEQSGRYLNKTNLLVLAKQFQGWQLIAEDVRHIEAYLGHEVGPVSEEEKEHEKITTQILKNYTAGKEISSHIVEAGILRRSLG